MRKRTNLVLVSFVVMLSLALAPQAFGDTEVYVDTSDVYTTDNNIITNKFIYYHIDARGTKLFEDYGETNLIPYYFGGSAIVSSDGNFFDKVVNIEIVGDEINFPMEIWIQTFINNESPFDYTGFHFEIYDSQFTQRIDQVKFLNTTTGYINDYHIYNDVLDPSSQIFDLSIEAGISSFGLRQVAAVVGGQQPVPEPATMLLLGTGLVGLAGFRRKFKKS